MNVKMDRSLEARRMFQKDLSFSYEKLKKWGTIFPACSSIIGRLCREVYHLKEQTFADTIFQYKETWFRIAMGIAKNESDAEDILNNGTSLFDEGSSVKELDRGINLHRKFGQRIICPFS